MYKYKSMYLQTDYHRQTSDQPDSPAVIIRQRLHRTNTHSVTFSHDRSLTAANNQMKRIYTDCQWLKTILNNNNYSKQPTAQQPISFEGTALSRQIRKTKDQPCFLKSKALKFTVTVATMGTST